MQSIPLAVLKLNDLDASKLLLKLHAIHTACGIETPSTALFTIVRNILHAIHTACGIETRNAKGASCGSRYCMQSIPLAVLKRDNHQRTAHNAPHCMQSIPLAVLKQGVPKRWRTLHRLHAIHTACGIETLDNRLEKFWVCILHAIHTACGIFFIFSALFSNVRFFYGIMELLEDSF